MAEFVMFIICVAVIAIAFWIARFIPQGDCWPHRARFQEVYPPISDEEFLRRLSPEVPPEIGLKVRELLYECIGVPENQIYPEAGLLELIGDVPPRFEQTPPPRRTSRQADGATNHERVAWTIQVVSQSRS